MGDARSRVTTTDGIGAAAAGPVAAVATAPDSEAVVSGRALRVPGPVPRPGDIRPDAPPEAPEPKPVPLMRASMPVPSRLRSRRPISASAPASVE